MLKFSEFEMKQPFCLMTCHVKDIDHDIPKISNPCSCPRSIPVVLFFSWLRSANYKTALLDDLTRSEKALTDAKNSLVSSLATKNDEEISQKKQAFFFRTHARCILG